MPLSAGRANWLAVQGLDQPSSSEFLAHPDYRQIAAFFLGWVFFYSTLSILQSQLGSYIVVPIGRLVGLSDHKQDVVADEKSGRGRTSQMDTPEYQPHGDNLTLNLALFLCVALASLALFISLLSYSPTDGATACAFFSAWGFMAAKSIVLVGILSLSLQLRQLEVPRIEAIAVWCLLAIVIALVFVTAAFATGFLSVIVPLGFALCSRKYFLPTSIVASLLYLFIEVYLVLRFYLRLGTMQDVRIARAVSLLLLTLLTMVPDAVPTSTIANFIPFSIGACMVIVTFKGKLAPEKSSTNKPATALSATGYIFSGNISYPSAAQPAHDSTEAMRGSDSPSPIPEVEIIAASQRSSQVSKKSIPPPLESLPPSSSYVSGPLREEYTAFQSPTLHTAQSNNSDLGTPMGTPMATAFLNAALKMPSTTSRSMVAQQPALLHAQRVTSSVPVLSEAHWRQSTAGNMAGPQRRIVASQVQYAEQIEEEDYQQARAWPTGPQVPPVSRPQVNLNTDVPREPQQPTARTVDSVTYGSDIIRATSSATQKDRTKRHSSWAPSFAPVVDSDEPWTESETSPHRAHSRRSVTSTIVSIYGQPRAGWTTEDIPPLPMPAYRDVDIMETITDVTPPPLHVQPKSAGWRGATLPPEIARLATEPLRFGAKSQVQSLAVRGPRPPPTPPSRSGERSTPAAMYFPETVTESPGGSPVEDTWRAVGAGLR